MTAFTDELLDAIGAWQNGWREDQARRAELALTLQDAATALPPEFRCAGEPCYRKRFIHRGELVDLILADERHEGVTSWTNDLAFAERFKGLLRPDAVSAAIFRHVPEADDVVVNIAALWQSEDFAQAVCSYETRGGAQAVALNHFRDRQGEVVLTVPLRGSEIIALSGISSPFDELCDYAGVAEEQREILFKQLHEQGVYPGEPRYTSPEGAQRVLRNTILAFESKMGLLKRH